MTDVRLSNFSEFERTILFMIALGMNNRAISLGFSLPLSTVTALISDLYRVLKVNTWGSPRVRVLLWLLEQPEFSCHHLLSNTTAPVSRRTGSGAELPTRVFNLQSIGQMQ